MYRTFSTPGPTAVHVEIASGSVTVRAEEVDQTTVDVAGDLAEETLVEQRGGQIVVIGPKNRLGFFRSSPQLTVQVTLPVDSELSTQLGAADLVASGRLGSAHLRSGSGDIDLDDVLGEAQLDVGSGDVDLATANGDVKVRCGSGKVALGQVRGSVNVATGSGDVVIEHVEGDTVLKSASGDTRVRHAAGHVAATTASGHVVLDTVEGHGVQVKNVSGDIHIGVPAGTPVWTDVSTMTGRIVSSLASVGQPADGQAYVELRATTISGDIHLEQR